MTVTNNDFLQLFIFYFLYILRFSIENPFSDLNNTSIYQNRHFVVFSSDLNSVIFIKLNKLYIVCHMGKYKQLEA